MSLTKIKQLKQDQHHELTTARKIRDKARQDGRELTGEESTALHRAMDEVERYDDLIRTEERLEGIDTRLDQFTENGSSSGDEDDSSSGAEDVIRTVPMHRGGEDDREDRADAAEDEEVFDPYRMRNDIAMWEGGPSARRFRDARLKDMSINGQRKYLRHMQSREYNEAFWRQCRGRGFTRTHRDSLDHLRTMVEGVDADGGYLAPTQLVGGIQYEAQVLEELKPRMDVISGSARSLTFTKGLDSIVMGWVAELGTKPEDQLSFAQTQLTAHVAAVVSWISDELLEDETYGLQTYLSTKVGEAKTLLEEEAFISGSGTGRPWGILTRLNAEGGTPNRYTTGAVAAGNVANISDDIVKIPYTMPVQYRRNSVWIVGTNFIRMVRLQRDASGASAATGNYMWQPSLQAGEPATLNGYPVIESTSVALNSAIATGNDVGIFGDLRRYRVYERIGLQVKRLEELRSLTDEVGFRFRFRVGGDVMYNPAFRTIRLG